jgi:hypothetical protein
MLAKTLESCDAALGAVCRGVVDMAAHVSPAVGRLLDWDVDDLGPLVPVWSA